MPLASHLPVIDDRTFDDIVAEARSRIPRYTPEWTDSNASDPGFTLVELFAWLTEMQLFRLGRVPALNYLKFLQLLGLELMPARPAACEVTFPVRGSFSEPVVIVPRLTQVSTDKPDEQGSIIFETEEALMALRATLGAVQVFDGYAYADVTQQNDELGGFEPFSALAETDSALLLGFSDPAPFPDVEINLSLLAAEANVDRGISCFAGTGTFVSSEVVWESFDGTSWRKLNVLRDDTAALTRSGHVYLRGLPAGAVVAAAIGAVAAPHYWLRARLVHSAYDSAPRITAVRSNTVRAIQAQTARHEVLGGSDGAPHQLLSLANRPLLPGTLELEVDEGQGASRWHEVADFFASGAADQHVVVNRTTAEIRFGDGVHGRIPVANPDRPTTSIVARAYRFGGGKRGNVPAGSLTTLLSSVPGVDANGITNLVAAAGGADEETLEAAKQRAPRSIKSRERAVAPEDFESLALGAAAIKRAKALPLYHPRFEGVEVPGAVSVIIVPDVEGEAPFPSEGTLRTVCAYLDQRRLLTTELFVLPPSYREVKVTADVVVHDGADLADVKLAIEDTLRRYFHPLIGGDESSLSQDGSGWPFGGDIYYAMVIHRLMVPGVMRIAELHIELDGETAPPCCDITIEPIALLKNGEHDIRVRYHRQGDR
jgi:predicted phage baseplate assembly protein